MTRKIGLRLFSVLVVPLSVSSCASSDSQTEESADGVAQIAITQVPTDVQCIQILAQGNRSVERLFAVTSGESSILTMTSLPIGTVEFSGNAYSGNCSASVTGQDPAFTAAPVSAQVMSGSPAQVTLTMRRNGRATVNVDFEDACLTEGTACTSESECCSGQCVSGVCAAGTLAEGPCDLYAAGNTPCVAAYSTVRHLSSGYSGPLYQVRSGSSNQNTGSGGTLYDIGVTEDGFADAAAQDAVCTNTVCTVSKLYDQSGHGNDLTVAKAGTAGGGPYSAMDDFESIADAGPLTVGGHQVYSLYMAARQGYRLPVGVAGASVPRGTSAQGIYMLADGTHYGTACCWDFGNVTTDPTVYQMTNAMFFGVGYWGRGMGNGPWFMVDFGSGIWAGGSGASTSTNSNLPSSNVPFAFGILKTDPNNYAIRVANLQTASDLTTAYEGALPQLLNNQGGIVLGVGPDNSNNSWGTFYEGAVVSGYPTAATELSVLQNLQAAGYGQ